MLQNTFVEMCYRIQVMWRCVTDVFFWICVTDNFFGYVLQMWRCAKEYRLCGDVLQISFSGDVFQIYVLEMCCGVVVMC